MNRQSKEYKSKVWQYFAKQKIEEITNFFGNMFVKIFWIGLVFFGIIILPYLIGIETISVMEWSIEEVYNIFISEGKQATEGDYRIIYWGLGLIVMLVITFIISIMKSVIEEVIKWLKSNWKKAKRKADKHFKLNKSRRKKWN